MNKRQKIAIIIAAIILLLAIASAIIYNIMTAGNRKQIAVEKKLVEQLPYDNGEFRVEHGGAVPGGEYTISLYAILNGDSQLAQYNIDLKQYKKDSIKWLSDNGVDSSKLKIIWLPEEAAKL